MRIRTLFVGSAAAALSVLIGWLAWRMIHPPDYIDVSDWFARPIATAGAQTAFDLSAQSCGACHKDIADEWSQTLHAKVWSDPVFQADWRHQGANPVCRNCHTPLDRQQELFASGAPGGDRWSAARTPNPDFDPALRREGVTCAACHLRDGKVFGPWADPAAPHPTAAWANPNEACLRCHLAANTKADSFLRAPPCGTVDEILRASGAATPAKPAAPAPDGYAGPVPVADVAALGCVECHMPAVARPVAEGGPVRQARRHLWRGGHDLATVRAALSIGFQKSAEDAGGARYTLTLTNTGAAHDVPTGAADRRLTVTLQVLDASGRPLQTQTHTLERKVLGRPILIDLWDTRLRPNAPQSFFVEVPAGGKGAAVEARVDYGLISPSHSEQIGYRQPVSQEIFRARIPIAAPGAHSG